MALTESQKKANTKYAKNNLKRVPLDLQKTHYAIIKAHAERRRESVNGFIKRAIDETTEQDNTEGRHAG